jgi:hypothetical protein
VVGAMHHGRNPKNKKGYFGGYCDCGTKLGENFHLEGIEIVEKNLNRTKRVYASKWIKWKNSLSEVEHQKIFGGPKSATIYQFDYNEEFAASGYKLARKRFFELVKILKKQLEGKARFAMARLYGKRWTGKEDVWLIQHGLQTAGLFEEVCQFLESEREKLGIVWRSEI